jgi:hypothetical protein
VPSAATTLGVLVSPDDLPGGPGSSDGPDGAAGRTRGSARPGPDRDRSSEQERLERFESLDADSLRTLVASMPVIEQAKGIVMGCYGVDSAAAFEVLARLSSSGNLKLRVLAATVVQAASSRTTSVPGQVPVPCQQVRRVIGAGPVADGRAAR